MKTALLINLKKVDCVI